MNGSIFYYFGSMDGLLAATAKSVGDRGVARIRDGLGGEAAHLEWPSRLASVMKEEAHGVDGRAVMELFVAARTSPAMADEVRAAVDRAIGFVTDEMRRVLGPSPVTQLIPVEVIAELAAAAFLGLEILVQSGREVDLDRVADVLATVLRTVGGVTP